MKNNITKVIFILLMISGLIIVNMWAFRSSIPFTVIPTMLGSILLMLYTPWNKVFKTKKKLKNN